MKYAAIAAILVVVLSGGASPPAVLTDRGAPESTDVVESIALLKTPDPIVRESAVRRLASWPKQTAPAVARAMC